MLQKELGLRTVGALDIRNQCSGFVYALSIADQYIMTGMYKNILIVGSEFEVNDKKFRLQTKYSQQIVTGIKVNKKFCCSPHDLERHH